MVELATLHPRHAHARPQRRNCPQGHRRKHAPRAEGKRGVIEKAARPHSDSNASPMKGRITRRHALKTTGALLISGALPAQEPKKPKRAVVIGGGIGGLSCAFELMELGHE